MALSSVQAALDQYAANIPWYGSQSAAQLALAAVQYLLINRAQKQNDQGSELNYESLTAEKAALEKFLGATTPRAFGRSRVNNADFCGGSSIQ